MHFRLLFLVLVAGCMVLTVGCATAPPDRARVDADLAALQAFAPLTRVSAAQLAEYHRRRAAYLTSEAQYRAWLACNGPEPQGGWPAHCGRSSERPKEQLDESSERLERVEVTGSRVSRADVITNNQEPGIDEGGILKKHGDHLIALRGSHLYSINLARAGTEVLVLRDVEALPNSEYGPWLDELLVADDTIVVLGYNPDTSVSELLLFGLTADGDIQPRGRFEFESEDYFVWENYGARLVGDELVVFVRQQADELEDFDLPRWRAHGGGDAAWRRMEGPSALFLPVSPSDSLHLTGFLRCRLASLRAGRFDCAMAGILSGRPEAHYIAADAAYFSTTAVQRAPGAEPDPELDTQISTVYRLPFAAGASPAFARVPGHMTLPTQFASRDGSLLVVSDDHDPVYALKGRNSEPPWVSGRPREPFVAGQPTNSLMLRLMRINWQASPGRVEHQPIILSEQESVMFEYQVRIIGGRAWIAAESARDGSLVAQDNLVVLDETGGVALGTLPFAAERVESVDDRVLLSGDGEDAGWQLVLARVDSARIAFGPPHRIGGFEDAERRTHGFSQGVVAGRSLLGLVGRRAESRADANYLEQHTGLFFEADDLLVRPAGQFDAARFARRPAAETYDEPDWYGSSRIAFVGERVFMLAKWGLIEGRVTAGAVTERRGIALEPNCCGEAASAIP